MERGREGGGDRVTEMLLAVPISWSVSNEAWVFNSLVNE